MFLLSSSPSSGSGVVPWPLRLLLQLIPLLLVSAWEPTWQSLDSRPLPPWYDDAKFGIFIHWGIFSVPSFKNEWFWEHYRGRRDPAYVGFVNTTERPNFTYQEYASRFKAELYDPEVWAELFALAGAQYVVLTSKHHEGYCMWDSRDVPTTWNWNVMDVGPRRDLLGDLSRAVKKKVSPHTGKTLHWGTYHSLFEWFNPLFLADKANDFTTTVFRDTKSIPELYDLVQKYEPELIWSDGDWISKEGDVADKYWNAPEFLAWYATNSTVADTAVWNDRWGGTSLKHGAYYSGSDRFQPGKLLPHKWENALTVDKSSWGLDRSAPYDHYYPTEYFIHELAQTIAFGGNMLLNVGPGADGIIDPIFHDRLRGIGEWLKVNGEAIYGTKPWKVMQNETAADVYYTSSGKGGGTVYAIVTKWPGDNVLRLKSPQTSSGTNARMLGVEGYLKWSAPAGGGSGINVNVPPLTPDKVPCQHAWVFALGGLANANAGGSGVERTAPAATSAS